MRYLPSREHISCLDAIWRSVVDRGSSTALTSVAAGFLARSVWATRLHSGRRTHPACNQPRIQKDDCKVTRPFDVLVRHGWVAESFLE